MLTRSCLRIVCATSCASLDPHCRYFGPERLVHRHIYESLVLQDEQLRLRPGLALSWAAVSDHAVAFHLRPNVTWHDGTPFTSDDVAFSLDRASHGRAGYPGLGMFTHSITRVETPDPLTVVVHTHGPAPLLPNELANVFIVARHCCENATSLDFDSGLAVIGTGPYRLVEWVRGKSLGLAAGPDHWDGPPEWDTVRIETVGDDAARVQTIVAGAPDLVDQIPPGSAGGGAMAPGWIVADCASIFLLHLTLDQFRTQSPWITSKSGRAIGNPLLDRRVRMALSMAIDRAELVRSAMQGAADPADQLISAGFPGHISGSVLDPFDPASARALLRDAGYAEGWRMDFHGTVDRYTNDRALLERVAEAWRAIGLDVVVHGLPYREFIPRSAGDGTDSPGFSVTLSGWAAPTGEASSTLRSLLATHDPKAGMGTVNKGRYANPRFDALLRQALRTADDTRREEILQDCVRLSLAEDCAMIPLVYPRNRWAVGSHLRYQPRCDGLTSAMDARKRPAA